MSEFEDKVVIVTGAGGGIGREHALAVARRGARVLVNDLGSDVRGEGGSRFADQVVDEIKALGGHAVGNYDSVAEPESAKAIVQQAVDEFGTMDILINNAGITRDNLSIRMKDEEWKKVIDVNLTSTFLLSKNTIKKMLKNKKGKIINITSVVGHSGNIGQANYAASKSGIVGMSKSLALEYGKKNIKVNCVSPGFITSNMTDKISDEFKEILKSRISLNKFGEPQDVANTIVFLYSDLSNYITGETIHVNGGMYFS